MRDGNALALGDGLSENLLSGITFCVLTDRMMRSQDVLGIPYIRTLGEGGGKRRGGDKKRWMIMYQVKEVQMTMTSCTPAIAMPLLPP